ncbi:MAG TPA: ATP-grasp domain-containing protein [Thermoanaerobaculia bacterium]|jgi:formate-dependent phosphoribosylglycinamide formyltransferase (GAR transformylase)|nr:ATP-grasp domain-containing protein [Thermoanaerobaculia bacterium]
MPKHVALVGADLFPAYFELARGLKQVGARVTGIGATGTVGALPAALKPWLDAWEPVSSLTDPQAIADAARRAARAGRGLDRLETGDENLVVPTAEARAALGLPGLSMRTAVLCRDKPAMKEALRAAGLPCAESAAVASLGELEAFAARVGYPLAVKPRAGLGSLGTRRVDDANDLRAAARALGVDQGRSAAVEEWIEGHEGFFDTLTIGGTVAHEFIAHYYPPVLQALADRALSPQIAATNRVEVESYRELREVGRQVIAALGIDTAATHMEWFFGSKGLKVSEIGARPAGERIWDLYCVGNDMDVWREWAMAVVHGRPGARPSRRLATGSVQVRPDRDGRIVRYEGLHEVLAAIKPYAFQHHLPKPGTPTDPIYKGYLNNVWFRLRHPDYDALRGLMDFVGQTLKVRAA